MGSSNSSKEYRKYRNRLHGEIRRENRKQTIALVDKVKEKPKRVYKHSKGNQTTRE